MRVHSTLSLSKKATFYITSALTMLYVGGLLLAPQFVAPAHAACTDCTIFPSTSTPATSSASDSNAVELGVKFRSDSAGTVSGIRFYKGSSNTGTHIGSLWDGSGNLLASATFTNETASGWQQVDFSSPVTIAANVMYVASYYAPAGHYAVDSNYFGSSVDNAPLHAYSSAVSGGNGVFKYGSTSAFPTDSFNNGNYWVDVVFTEDTTPPTTVFSDEFTGSSLDAAKWTALDRAGDPSNGEEQCLKPANVTVGSGNLTITDQQTSPIQCSGQSFPTNTYDYTSGQVVSNFEFTYGKVEFRAKMPTGAGQWPAVWMDGANCRTTFIAGSNCNWPVDSLSSAEIDMLEMISNSSQIKTGIHNGTSPGTDNLASGCSSALGFDSSADFHTYSFTWQPGSAIWQVDGVTKCTKTTNVPAHPMFLTMNVALGGTAGTIDNSALPQNMQVDYIRVYPNADTVVLAAPSAPTDLATTANSSQVALDWTASTSDVGVAGYNVFRATGSGSASQIGTTTTASFQDTNVSPSTSYTYTVKAYDAAGNTSAASNASTVTTPAPGNVHTIFAPTATPTNASTNDFNAVELGVKFRSDVAGNVNGIRFYKGSSNTGTHVGSLWDSSGNLLATATFTNETASGWQEVDFSSPVAISANTTYVASYFAPAGRYAGDNASNSSGGFASTGVDNAPLHALANGVDGSNGLYKYGSSSTFPTESFNATNYWVDVVFEVPTHTIFAPTATPTNVTINDTHATELGTKFRSDVAGTISGIRFYKGSSNTGTHVGNLWDSAGNLLATATFSNESSSGWQQVDFSSPVSIAADTTYIASYYAPNGHYSGDSSANSTQSFSGAGVDNAPLHALADGTDGSNGVYSYSGDVFPTSTFGSTNYWVDVVFEVGSSDTTPPTAPTSVTATAISAIQVNLSWTASTDDTGVTGYKIFRDGTQIGTSSTTSFGDAAAAASTTYAYTVKAYDAAGNLSAASSSASATTPSSSTTHTISSPSATPTNASASDGSGVEIGVKFRSDSAGTVSGIRFYKGSGNTGTHVGSLWSSTGALLASATFVNETASGWQTVNFSSPVSVAANTTYVASYYAPVGHYAADSSTNSSTSFASAGVDNAPLHALANGVDGGNGVFNYGSSSVFPTSSFNSSNYWVDVVFE